MGTFWSANAAIDNQSPHGPDNHPDREVGHPELPDRIYPRYSHWRHSRNKAAPRRRLWRLKPSPRSKRGVLARTLKVTLLLSSFAWSKMRRSHQRAPWDEVNENCRTK